MTHADATDPVPRRMREERAIRGLSTREAADLAGMSKSQWSRYERGEDMVDRRSSLAKIAKGLGISRAALTGEPYTPSNSEDARAQGAVETIRETLRRIELGDLGEPADVEELPWRVAAAREASLRCDLDQLGRMLPDLALGAVSAARNGSARAAELAVPVMRMTFQAVKDLGFHDLAWSAVGHAHRAALTHGHAGWIALTEFDRARAMGGTNAAGAALALVRRAADELDPAGPDAEAYGVLLLSAALHSAIVGAVDDVPPLLDEAAEVAERTGDGTFGDMHFGPTNLAIWRVTLAVETGDLPRVPELAAAVDVAAIPSRDRQAMFNIDLGRGLAVLPRRQAAAVHALNRAESRAPQLVHANFYARQAVVDLRRQLPAGTKAGDEVRGLARRMKIAA